MAKISLTSSFAPLAEGIHTMTIESVEYNEAFGSLKIFMAAENGKKHMEKYSLLNKSGEVNNGAMNAFSFFARSVMGDNTLAEIDPEQLAGLSFTANVTHTTTQSTQDPNKTFTNVKFNDIVPTEVATAEEQPNAMADLRALLG